MGVNPPAFIGASAVTINGDTDYKMISGEIDSGQEVSLTMDPTNTYGYDLSQITKRKISWQAVVYQDVPATVDPQTALQNQTTGALTFTYGTAPNKISFTSSNAQIDNIENGEEGGVQTWTLSGKISTNDLSVELDTSS
jgi:hypothetical protein